MNWLVFSDLSSCDVIDEAEDWSQEDGDSDVRDLMDFLVYLFTINLPEKNREFLKVISTNQAF